jgi:hypothetical protein
LRFLGFCRPETKDACMCVLAYNSAWENHQIIESTNKIYTWFGRSSNLCRCLEIFVCSPFCTTTNSIIYLVVRTSQNSCAIVFLMIQYTMIPLRCFQVSTANVCKLPMLVNLERKREARMCITELARWHWLGQETTWKKD